MDAPFKHLVSNRNSYISVWISTNIWLIYMVTGYVNRRDQMRSIVGSFSSAYPVSVKILNSFFIVRLPDSTNMMLQLSNSYFYITL